MTDPSAPLEKFCVGLTGGIGSGKSTVTNLFAARGAAIVDTDIIAHQLTAPNGIAIPAIREAFGADFIDASGAMDRAKMRAAVFAALYNDADGGIDGAGFTRLPALDARGIAAATYSAWTARIGDGRSAVATGIVSSVNRRAAALGPATFLLDRVAERTFELLMGSLVAPRREFIIAGSNEIDREHIDA